MPTDTSKCPLVEKWRESADEYDKEYKRTGITFYDGGSAIRHEDADWLESYWREKVDGLLREVNRVTKEVIVGYENEQQEGWASNAKDHQCKVWYNSAKRTRAALARLTEEK